MARVYLAQGRFDECEDLVNQIERSTQATRWNRTIRPPISLLTKAEVLARRHRWDESLAAIEHILSLAHVADDQGLGASARLLRAEVLLQLERPAEAWQSIAEVVPSISVHPPDMYTLYERVVACVLAGTGDLEAGRRHHDRARTIYQGLHNAAALVELSRSWEEAAARQNRPLDSQGTARPGANLVQNIAAFMRHAGRPELLATSLVAVLSEAQCAAAAAILRNPHGPEEVLASYGTAGDADGTRVLNLGTAHRGAVEVRVRALADIESQATLNSIVFLLGTVADLEQGHSRARGTAHTVAPGRTARRKTTMRS